jgi:hypothetical protein
VASAVLAILVAALVALSGPAQAQTAPATDGPRILITEPGPDTPHDTRSSLLTISGIADDSGGLVEVTWTSDRGASGTAAGAASWRIESIALQPGPNTIVITALGNSGSTATTALTITYEPETTTPTAPPDASTALASPPAALGAASTALAAPSAGGAVIAPVVRTSSAPTSPTPAKPAPRAAVPSAVVPSAAANGLVAGYTFNEGAGSAVADVSGSQNNGTLSPGARWTTEGKFGKALLFNGSSLVTVPHGASLALTSGMTLEAWVYPTAMSTGWSAAIAKEQRDGVAYALHGGSPTHRPAASIDVGGVLRTVSGRAVLPLQTWTHLASTFDGATLRLYVNGAQVASESVTGAIASATGALRIGGSVVRGEYFRGRVDEVRVYNRALSQSEIQTDMTSPVAPPPDSTPPSVAITAPAEGATVFGLVSVSATASDDVGVVGVRFFVDGTPLGSEVLSAPYTVSWNASSQTPGAHVITAVARDQAGNTRTSEARHLTVVSSGPATSGQWAGPFTAPIVTIHATLLRTGKVVTWDGLGGGGNVHLWDPATGNFTAIADSRSNIFCSGHCALPDGKILVAGGHINSHDGLADANIFDPATSSWAATGSMSNARWYPTVTTLPDGRLLVTAGESGCSQCNVQTPEIYDPDTGTWTELSRATANIPFYPHMFVLPDGRVLAASSTEGLVVSKVLNVATQTWSVVDPLAVDGGSAVMYRPGKIMKSGTHNDADLPTIPAAPTTYVLDMTHAPPSSWRQTDPMAFARAYHHLTLLPDGQVLATGGGDTTDAVGFDGAVAPAELWSPTTEKWTTLAAMQTPRLYHSIALLLPDARVFVSGGGRFFGEPHPTDQLSFEVFSPPYLFKGTRPTITSAPTTATYGSSMSVLTPNAAAIASVVLIKPGSATHSFNGDQRYVPLSFAQAAGGLSVQAPASANLAPPGYYMLFLVDGNGIPSIAKFVRIQ